MILQIKKLLAQRKIVTLGEIAIHCDIEPKALEPIMQKLVEAGVARKHKPADIKLCGGCKVCPDKCELTMIIYEYVK